MAKEKKKQKGEAEELLAITVSSIKTARKGVR